MAQGEKSSRWELSWSMSDFKPGGKLNTELFRSSKATFLCPGLKTKLRGFVLLGFKNENYETRGNVEDANKRDRTSYYLIIRRERLM